MIISARLLRFGLALAAVALSACSPMKLGGDIALNFTEEKTVPFMLKDNDVDMACASGETLTPVLRSFAVLGSDADQIAALMYVTAAYCSEQRAFEEELRYLRASRSNQIEEAQDARIAQKRQAEVAARRQYAAYQAMERYYKKHFNINVGERCPSFHRPFDEVAFMLGMISGMQAIANDINSQNQVNVPKDIGAKVERGMSCLDNSKWWGVPNGVRAAVWNMLPGAAPAGRDPWDELVKSTKVADDKGVRLAHALYAISAQTKGDEQHLRDALRNFAKSSEKFNVDPNYMIFDRMAVIVIQNISDRYWTEHTGTRTPIGSMGKFWDDKTDVGPGVNIDDLM